MYKLIILFSEDSLTIGVAIMLDIVEHRLAEFSGQGYARGRPAPIQALWFVTQHLIFKAWWLPGSLRPPILRVFGAKIGRGVIIRRDVRVHWPWKLDIGDDVWIGEGAWLLNLEKITVGSNVCISQEALLCAGSHQRRSQTFEFDNGPITIERSAWIAARGVVLRGVTVSAGAVVGANAVASAFVPAGAVILSGSHIAVGAASSDGV